jgi:hypothetical protein
MTSSKPTASCISDPDEASSQAACSDRAHLPPRTDSDPDVRSVPEVLGIDKVKVGFPIDPPWSFAVLCERLVAVHHLPVPVDDLENVRHVTS